MCGDHSEYHPSPPDSFPQLELVPASARSGIRGPRARTVTDMLNAPTLIEPFARAKMQEMLEPLSGRRKHKRGVRRGQCIAHGGR